MLFYKCNFCDPITKRGEKPVKSINAETDEFIKDDKGKYYHLSCYKKYLKDKKKLADIEIEKIINDCQEKRKLEIKENKEKDRFLQWIMNFYDGSLPAYFMTKLQKVREGTHEGINEPIDYLTMLDIYQHMENYLRKLRAKKQIKNITQQMNYDLAVVIGNYGNYKKYKAKQEQNVVSKNDINKQIEIEEKVNAIKNNKEYKDDDSEFNLTDIIDELMF